MKNLLKQACQRLNSIQEKIALIDLDHWEQEQARNNQKWAHIKNECSGIKGTYIDSEGNVTFCI